MGLMVWGSTRALHGRWSRELNPREFTRVRALGLYLLMVWGSTRALHGRWSRELNPREFTRVCALGLYLLMVWGSTRALHGLYTVDGLGSSILVNSRGLSSLDHRPCRAPDHQQIKPQSTNPREFTRIELPRPSTV